MFIGIFKKISKSYSVHRSRSHYFQAWFVPQTERTVLKGFPTQYVYMYIINNTQIFSNVIRYHMRMIQYPILFVAFSIVYCATPHAGRAEEL